MMTEPSTPASARAPAVGLEQAKPPAPGHQIINMTLRQPAAPTGSATAPIPAEARPARHDRRSMPIAGASVHMIGIGGCGMSGMARLLRARGASVCGCDGKPTQVTEALSTDHFDIVFDETADCLPEHCDMVVASAAVRPDHAQVLEAERRGTPVYTYAEMLGRLMGEHTGVALAGTHGKSTTTAMLGAALTDAGLDPSVIVGATCPQLAAGALGSPVFSPSTGFRLGGPSVPAGPLRGAPGLLLAEACEFNRSFHSLRPRVASISAVEADHLDIYGSLDAVVEAFHDFARLVPPAEEGGTLLIAHEGAHRREVTAGVACRVETIGYSPEADWHVDYDPASRRVTLSRDGAEVAAWTMRMPGPHNAINAATAAALAILLGAGPAVVGRSLGAFRGVDRRTQLLGERALDGGSVRVYDDYGHHPTEVDATLRALREHERPQDRGGRLICVFQPHQHSRTRFLLEEFATAFSQADVVIVPHIYFVRDSQAERQRVAASDLVDRLRRQNVRAMHLYPFEAIIEQLENVCRPGDLLVVMGAGPVWQVARGYLGFEQGVLETFREKGAST